MCEEEEEEGKKGIPEDLARRIRDREILERLHRKGTKIKKLRTVL